MIRKATYVLLVLIMVLVTSCMVGKKYSRPAMPPGIEYPDVTKTDTSALATWFNIYHDTALQTLIKAAIDSNRDLLAAARKHGSGSCISRSRKGKFISTFRLSGRGRRWHCGNRCNENCRRCAGRIIQCFWSIELGTRYMG